MFQAKTINNETIVIQAPSFDECIAILECWQPEFKIFKIYLNDEEYCTYIPKQ